MKNVARTAAGIASAALLLTAWPATSFAHDVTNADVVSAEQSSDDATHTISTTGSPAFAAMLNAGTQYSVLLSQARATGIEIAGVQTSDDGSPLLVTVSTSGDPAHAALLNAGTAFTPLNQAR